ncbi:beta-ketoacyl synthase domain-containing protein [Phlyctema vagabunda]|uniref:Beta-ketoacyl synthase domain-containing protein n=1 Tax=Phlyctema vagabunda TaxID=108571 RepID=A0ABR4P9G3_9HELO
MRSPGSMFCENIDVSEFDAPFFGISRVDAVAMDPQQRQIMEVVYEGLENAGIPLESLAGKKFGVFVGSYGVDYADMGNRDPEDRPTGVTVGVGRAIQSGRLSHFLNTKGLSMTLDTACSGSLVGVDLACRYLDTRQIDGAIIAASNIYLSPEGNMDRGAMREAWSATGFCHTFDAKADGYIKSEATNMVILKRLDDAIRDNDPIRAIIRGSATNSNGWTPGIASPSSAAQSEVIRAAYQNAGITDFSKTTYLECHGTGTLAGDPIEAKGAGDVFADGRTSANPLLVGSIKSNVGHSEPAAGISGLMKAVLAIENKKIPGTPTFVTPNPKIQFEALKIKASRTAIPWPKGDLRRASVNSFGYSGANAHVVIDDIDSSLSRASINHVSSYVSGYADLWDDDDDDELLEQPQLLVFSANDDKSLKEYAKAISRHIINPNVKLQLSDLAYTLSERRSRHFNRAYLVTQSTKLEETSFVYGKKSTDLPKLGFVFTGQGAQWSQMGKELVQNFPQASVLLKKLDTVLQNSPNPPTWSLFKELVEPRSPETLRLPEFSQPLVTALQLVLLDILQSWGIEPVCTVGHSSGEIAAAYAAGYLTQEEAIKIAFYRGRASSDLFDPQGTPVGMLAVGLGATEVTIYLETFPNASQVQIGCVNSPKSVTVSGEVAALTELKALLDADGHFARLLQVDLAYHSKFMTSIGNHYHDLLVKNCVSPEVGSEHVSMFSSVTGHRVSEALDSNYWKANMVSPVLFDQALEQVVSTKAADYLIEIGPSGALAGPIAQILKSMDGEGPGVQYCASYKRGKGAVNALYEVAGRMFVAGMSVDMTKVNQYKKGEERPRMIIDLPNYAWNHATKYWYENEASKEWRFRQFPHHDLIGTKILGTSWHSPSFKKSLRVSDLPWLKDHKMGHEIVFPAAGFMAMAVEALYQTSYSLAMAEGKDKLEGSSYRFRNVSFMKALVLEDNGDAAKVMITLSPRADIKGGWYQFKVSSLNGEQWNENCRGDIKLEEDSNKVGSEDALKPLAYSTPASSWYKAMTDAGYTFGPAFEKHLEIESIPDTRRSRSLVSLEEPTAEYKQSAYAMHPACIDGCLQSVTPSLWQGNRASVDAVLVPAMIDHAVINWKPKTSSVGIATTTSSYIGVGPPEDTKSYMSSASVYDQDSGALLFELRGLRYHKLDTRADLHASHTYNRVIWKPHLDFLKEDQIPQVSSELLTYDNLDGRSSRSTTAVIDILGHTKPNLKLMEINMAEDDSSSLWFDDSLLDKSSRVAYSSYVLATAHASTMVECQEKFQGKRKAEFQLIDLSRDSEDFVMPNSDLDLIILKLSDGSTSSLPNIARNVQGMLADGGQVLVMSNPPIFRKSSGSGSEDFILVEKDNKCLKSAIEALETQGFAAAIKIANVAGSQKSLDSAVLLKANVPAVAADPNTEIHVVQFSENAKYNSSIISSLSELGWKITCHVLPVPSLPAKAKILVLDELSSPLFPEINEAQWEAVQGLAESENRVLWVTEGSQYKVTKPTNAIVHGLMRTMRAEDPTLQLITLDVEKSEGPATVNSIDKILKLLQAPQPKRLRETEYAERDGIIYVSRISPDELINQEETSDSQGAPTALRYLSEAEETIRLRCERLGTLDALVYSEVSSDSTLKDDCVEVEIHAAGLNFKDIAVSMGIVPENQYLLGLEGAGVVKRAGKSVTKVKVGQRVMVYEKGTFANKIHATEDSIFPLPDSMTYEEAATLPSVYMVSMYGLFNVAHMHKGQSVLIHSASGGVGIAAIQLCKYIGAEVYATVGTDEKRQFLIDNFQIPSSRIFSSRTTDFASEILSLTDGRGVDIVLNSLTGELLDASWRIVADGGTLVEIGKRDMLDRNSLAMDPFNRNCSYQGVDVSRNKMQGPVMAKIWEELFGLIAKGHLKPIDPMKVFAFEDIPSAFRLMRSGKHIGKIVVSRGDTKNVEVPVRPMKKPLALRQEVSYLIVGGLKGLCGSLAIYLAQHGAKNLVILSRSGCADEKSQGIIRDLDALGCHLDLMEGDVSVPADVDRIFKEATVPISGVIQGAMVLRDKTFSSMTVEDYHQAIRCKVQGTWNIHNTALKYGLPLDFFTILSSISGVVGQKGQANYASANVFLDAFSYYRRQLGLNSNTVDLGVIEDVGYMHKHQELGAFMDSSIWTGINESLLHKILRFSILQQVNPINRLTGAQMITGIPVPQVEGAMLMRDARFGPLCFSDDAVGNSSDGKDGSKDIQAFFVLLRFGADHSKVLAACVDLIDKQLSTSLRLTEPIEPAKPLTSYGLDSLAAVEFRNWVRMELSAELTTLEITNSSSVFALCEKIISKIPIGKDSKET